MFWFWETWIVPQWRSPSDYWKRLDMRTKPPVSARTNIATCLTTKSSIWIMCWPLPPCRNKSRGWCPTISMRMSRTGITMITDWIHPCIATPTMILSSWVLVWFLRTLLPNATISTILKVWIPPSGPSSPWMCRVTVIGIIMPTIIVPISTVQTAPTRIGWFSPLSICEGCIRPLCGSHTRWGMGPPLHGRVIAN